VWGNGMVLKPQHLGEKKNPKLYTSELNTEDLDIKDIHKCNYKQKLLQCGER